MFATLRRSGGIEALARQVGHPQASVSAASEALIPELMACLREFVRNQGGEEAGVKKLLGVLDELGDGQLAADVMGHERVSPDSGESILASLCAGEGPARPDPGELAARSGLDEALLEHLLPLLAMLLCGYISARASGDREGDGLGWARDLLVAERRI